MDTILFFSFAAAYLVLLAWGLTLAAVPIPVESGAVTNAFELVLLISILWTVAHQDTAERNTDQQDAGGIRPRSAPRRSPA